MIGAEEA